MPLVRIACCIIRRAREPVFVVHRLFRYRYSLFEQENRFRPTDIRVSGVTALQRLGSRYSSSRSVSCVKRRTSCGISFINWPFFGDFKFLPSTTETKSECIHHLIMPESKPFERLPKTVVPVHYNLQLKPDLKTFLFEGHETIKIEVKEVTDKIVVNSLDLDIKSVNYITSSGSKIKPLDTNLSVEDETLTLKFGEPIPVGEGALEFHFTGELNDKMKGFYRSKYMSPDGEECYAGVTQFEATDARRCFPCWDEPAIKATFDIALVVPETKVALSNMPAISEKKDPETGLRTIKFDTTPVMSTYLVAVVVGEYDYVEDKSRDGVLVRVYTPVGKREQGRFALYVASKVLPYYKDYFQIAYPLPKIDLIAIADFSAGAMENWGLVTYRETCLLVDPENTSAVRKQLIALVVPVGHPSEIDEIFDDISYNKGASVIRMLHKYIGDEDFRKGMNLYLTRHQYKNTFTEDLWSALEEASNKPVGAVMSSWTKQMGFPVVRVINEQAGNDRKLTITQEKFCADGSTNSNGCLWMIPVMFSTSKKPGTVVHNAVLQTRSTQVTLNNVSADEWVKVNPGTVGYYRTQYPPDMLAQFVPAIRDKTLPPLDRLGLLDDLFAMVQAGHTPTVEVLKLMEAFTNEDNFTVWSSISNCLSKLYILLCHTDYEDLFHAYGRRLMQGVGARLGWDPKPNESHLETLLRSLVIGRLVWFKDEVVIAEAKKRFEDHISGKTLLPADLRSAVYRAVLSDSDESTYNTMLRLYREADLHEEKDRISRAFGAIKDESILKKVVQFAMSDEVRSQDSVFVIISVAMTKRGQEIAWSFFKENWQELMNRYQGGFLLARLVKYTTENFASEEAAAEVETFFNEHPTPGTERTVQQSCETIRLNAAWLKRDRDSTREYLSFGK
ncbi:Puromycin-sensitive aminopeptidase [Blattella germanica]|nr:Puromycin-sensitive aminopeptidase [Blattella germanica]